jgi:hypothetical protein
MIEDYEATAGPDSSGWYDTTAGNYDYIYMVGIPISGSSFEFFHNSKTRIHTPYLYTECSLATYDISNGP